MLRTCREPPGLGAATFGRALLLSPRSILHQVVLQRKSKHTKPNQPNFEARKRKEDRKRAETLGPAAPVRDHEQSRQANEQQVQLTRSRGPRWEGFFLFVFVFVHLLLSFYTLFLKRSNTFQKKIKN